MLERFLDDLEREMSRSLSGPDLQARLAEAEAHLRDGIEARVELGLSPEEAVCEAVAAYGQARHLAQAEPRSSAAPRIRLLLVGYAVGVVLFLGAIRLAWAVPYGVQAIFALWIGLGVAFAVQAFRSRRPAPIRVLSAGFVGALAVWVVAGCTWIDLAPYGGSGVLPPGEAETILRDDPLRIAQRTADIERLDAGMRALRSPQGIDGLRVPGGFRAPVVQDYGLWDVRLELHTVEDPTQAEAAWRSAARGNHWRDDLRRLRSNLGAVHEALAAPATANLLNLAPSILAPNAGVAGGAVLIDLVFGGLGALAFAARRRNRKGPLDA